MVIVQDCKFGKGVFAAQDIRPGDRVLRLRGQVITRAEMLDLGPHTSMNPLQIAHNLYLELDPPGVFLNHSCDPNAGIKDDIFLEALRPISKGEEICFDYSTTMLENFESMQCRCGHHSCRGVITDFIHLPPELQSRYARAGMVQDFIARATAGGGGGYSPVQERVPPYCSSP